MGKRHTPGPWFVVQGDEWTSDIATETPEQGVWTVASANKRRDEFEANKRLIAAAPDLLEALEAVVAISDRKHDAWDRAKAAIAKARGER